jgi:hypothetical protein
MDNEVVAAVHSVMTILSCRCVILLPAQFASLGKLLTSPLKNHELFTVLKNLLILCTKSPVHVTNREILIALVALAADSSSYLNQIKACQILFTVFQKLNSNAVIWQDKLLIAKIKGLVMFISDRLYDDRLYDDRLYDDNEIHLTGYTHAKLISQIVTGTREMRVFADINSDVQVFVKDWSSKIGSNIADFPVSDASKLKIKFLWLLFHVNDPANFSTWFGQISNSACTIN